MTQYTHRADLSSEGFPLLTEDLGRTVLLSNSKDKSTGEVANTPQVAYMHNVLPTKTGYASVGFHSVIAASPPGGGAVFEGVRKYTIGGVNTVIGITTSGAKLQVYSSPNWLVDTGALNSPGYEGLSLCHVNATSYVFSLNTPTVVYQWNMGSTSFVSNALIGSPLSSIRGITGAKGYLIAWGATGGGAYNSVAWSSTINPLDLTPSAVTGAGTAIISDLTDPIGYVEATDFGFFVYTEEDVVIAAVATGNKKFPFKFTKVRNAAGTYFKKYISVDTTSNYHYVLTANSGLQKISSTGAEAFLPELTDFLFDRVFEDYNETTNLFERTDLTYSTPISKAIRFVGNRYFILSYKLSTSVDYTHALVYDTALGRIGKVKVTHVSTFTYGVPKDSIAFLRSDGSVVIAVMSKGYSPRSGVLVLGKYQYSRDKKFILQKVLTETVASTDTFKCIDMAAQDGNSTVNVTGHELVYASHREYLFRSSATNHMLALVGTFDLSTVALTFSLGGKR